MKNLTPLQLPQLDTIPQNPQLGFYKIYLRDGVVYKLDGNGVETPIGNFVETEPLFTSSPAYSITLGNISQWNTAYGWGDHSTKGYLKTESDPVFVASPAYGISNALINQWSTAYGWGDHSVQGYLKTSLANTLYAPLVHTHTFAQITSKPTTLSGYGITDPIVLTSNAYSDPSWITALSWSKITGAPAFVTALAALTDVSLTSVADNQILRYSGGFWRNWSPDYLTAALADTLYIPFALRGAANGVASLNAQGQVPAAQLPSYVDDVLEFSSPAAFPVPGETGKIYVALNTNETYRWGGSSYIKIVGGEVQSVNLKTGNVLLNTDDIPEGISNLYYTNARVKTYGDTLYPQLAGVYNNPSWINTLSYTKLIDLPAFVQSTGTTNYVTKWAANGGLVNSIIFENGGVGINTNAVNAQAMLHVMGNNVRTKSLTLDSTWNYQTSFNMKNGNFSAEFNLGGSTKSANEGGPGSLQVSTYNATTNQFRYPITFFANGNVGLAGSLGSVPADNGNTLQVRGTIQQNSVISAMVKTDAAGVLVPAVAGVDYLVSVPTPTLQFVTTAGNTTTNPVIFNTTVGAGVYPLVINDNTSAYLALNVVNATGTRSGGVRFQTGGVDRNVLVFDAAANLAFARYNSLGVYLSDTMTLFNATGNIGIGTTTDVGYKLDAWGNFRFKGADDSATAALRVENSSNSYYYSFQNNGYLIMNGFLSVPVIDQSSLNIRSNNLLIGATGTTLARLQLSGNTNSSGAVARGMYINTSQTATANNDSLVALDIDASFVPGTFTGVSSIALRTLNGEVRHQGLANVTTTSMIYYNPTTGRLTYGAVPEVPIPTLDSVTTSGNITNNSINVGGLISPKVLISTSVDAGYQLDVNGTARVSGILTATAGISVGQGTSSGIYYDASNRIYNSTAFGWVINGWKYNVINAVNGLLISNSGTSKSDSVFLSVSGSATASSALAQGVAFNNTLVAAANDDVLVGLDITPTFNKSSFTGVTTYGIRITNNAGIYLYNGNNQYSSHLISTSNEVMTISNGNVAGRLNFTHNVVSAQSKFSVGFAPGIGTALNHTLYVNGTVGINTSNISAGYQLDVNGSVRIKGAGTTSATSSLLIQDSGNGEVLKFNDDHSGSYTLEGVTFEIKNAANSRYIRISGMNKDLTLSHGVIYANAGIQTGVLNLAQGGSTSITGFNQARVDFNGDNMVINSRQSTASILRLLTGINGTMYVSGYGNLAAAVNTSAQLQIDSTTQGFLQPRMTNTQVLAITTPATGLQAYDTTNNKNVLYTGSAWQNIATEAWVLANAPQTWTTGSGFIYYNSGDVVIGATTNAGFRFDVYGNSKFRGALTVDYGTSNRTTQLRDTGLYISRTSDGSYTGSITGDGNMVYGTRNSHIFQCDTITAVTIFSDTRNLVVGTAADIISSKLTINSTTQGFLAPRMTTAQRNAISSPVTGLMVFDTTVNRVSTYSGSTWEVFARELERRFDTVGDASYVGKAISGSSESANVWTIRRIVTTSSGDAIVTQATNVAWTDRLTVTYS
jgi:hypothetical protein